MAFLRFHIEPLFLSASPGACKSGGKKKKNKPPHTTSGRGGLALSRTGAGRRARRAVCCEQPSNTTVWGRALQYLGKPAVL